MFVLRDRREPVGLFPTFPRHIVSVSGGVELIPCSDPARGHRRALWALWAAVDRVHDLQDQQEFL